MEVVWVLLAVVVASALALLALLRGADTRSGVDGDGAFGRRHHQPETWW